MSDEEGRIEEKQRALADALLAARLRAPERFDYSGEEAIRRARQGSIADARMLLLLASAILHQRGTPFDHAATLPGWLAKYLAGMLDGALRDPKNAAQCLNLKPPPGRNAYRNAYRNACIAWAAGLLKDSRPRDYLKATADLLNEYEFPPPAGKDRKAGVWTAEAVKDAIKAHTYIEARRRRGKTPRG